MTVKTVLMLEELGDYVRSNSLREPGALAELRRKTAMLPDCNKQASPEVVQLLAMLLRLSGARRALEIGVYTGYSSLGIALALPKDGYLLSCDIDEASAQIALQAWENAGVASKIDFRLAPAAQTLDEAMESYGVGGFDFAFIDADKESYSYYYERVLPLLRPNGLIAIDNTLWDGNVIDSSDSSSSTKAIRQLNGSLFRDDRVDLSLVPIGDGLTLLRKR